MPTSVSVVGGGVVGLTTALALARSGFEVEVHHDSPLLGTTSAVATAIWHVYLVDPNDTEVLEWSAQTLEELLRLSREEPASGVVVVRGTELFRSGDAERPSWSAIPPYFRMLDDEEVAQFEGVRWGYEIDAPLVDMTDYLPWLESKVISSGVRYCESHVADMEELKSQVVVNCAGLRARDLVDDRELMGVRGQYLILKRDAQTPEQYIGDDEHPSGMAYFIPRPGDVCVGGTEEYGAEDAVFVADEAEMIRRASEFVPWLRTAEITVEGRVVGLRPWRKSGVRLEADRLPDGRLVVHNFGHGGSGFSLSYGCANRVVELCLADS